MPCWIEHYSAAVPGEPEPAAVPSSILPPQPSITVASARPHTLMLQGCSLGAPTQSRTGRSLASYEYKSEPAGRRRHLGFVIDYQADPSFPVDGDRAQGDVYGYAACCSRRCSSGGSTS